MMGSPFCTFEEAANRLGRTVRSIHNYTKQGMIRREVHEGRILLRREDVEQLAVDLGADLPAMNRKSFYHLESRLRRLEEQMTVVRRILDIKGDPLRITEVEAYKLVNECQNALTKTSWSTQELELWATVLDRFDETTLDTLNQVTHNHKCWQNFFNLVLNMLVFVAKVNKTAPSLQWEALYQKLDEGRKKLRGTILVWIEMGKGTIPEAFLDAMDEPKERFLKKLLRAKNDPSKEIRI